MEDTSWGSDLFFSQNTLDVIDGEKREVENCESECLPILNNSDEDFLMEALTEAEMEAFLNNSVIQREFEDEMDLDDFNEGFIQSDTAIETDKSSSLMDLDDALQLINSESEGTENSQKSSSDKDTLGEFIKNSENS